ADEPTSALDVTVQLQVLAILDDMVTQNGMGLIFSSHDLNLVAAFCDRALLLYAGQVMAVRKADDLQNAEHPYTRGLMSCLPQVGDRGRELAVLTRDAAWLDYQDGSSD
ncbi:MAG: ABC transporter ATP-binding protein, partial [Gammaproteobacteria bacterium]|nr:ABC transporter ATP-binding protein [Gammaproteobacteria bacterium]MDX2459627.1 ABC transporter ATP-binding protein [Gammaproteobacteria bacterium]